MDFLSEFTLAEMLEMESTWKEIGEEALNPEFAKKLATAFSCSPNRAAKHLITAGQVLAWFQDRHKKSHPRGKPPSTALKLFVDLSDESVPSIALESSENSKVFQALCLKVRKTSKIVVPNSHWFPISLSASYVMGVLAFYEYGGKRATDLADLTFEARSAKDNAWYDVASFLNYRVLCTGELEVRVRFKGYHNTDDEWVNVKRAVRERSIPLEPSECDRVKVGDHVLCFQDGEEQAVYHDAYVLDIQRQQHDATDCSCIFSVRYVHDRVEEEVMLERLCCRPN